MERINAWNDEVVVRLEAVFEDGRASVITEIGAVERSDLETLPGTAFGLTLAEGKTLFARRCQVNGSS
jgi:hypothetical protein